MRPAARLTDMHTCPMANPGGDPHVGGPIVTGERTVLIGELPAARVSDLAVCSGPVDSITQGAVTVLIGNLPAARLGDLTVHGGNIVTGDATVLIGDDSAGAGGATGATMRTARSEGAPLCELCCEGQGEA